MGRERPLPLLWTTLLVAASVLAGCSSGDSATESTEAGPGLAVLVDGRPGWSAAVEGAPVSGVSSVSWTGSELAVVHDGAETGSSDPGVVAYDPARGDWLDRGSPFHGVEVTDPVIGHAADGGLIVIASCRSDPEPPSDAAGDLACPEGGLSARVLAGTTWSPVEIPASGVEGSTVRFVGPSARGGAFDVGGQLLTITSNMAELGAESGLVDAAHCSDPTGMFAVARTGDRGDERFEVRWRGDGPWGPIEVPDVLVAALRDAPGEPVDVECSPAGVSFTRQDGAVTDLHAVAVEGGEPVWRRCVMPGGAFDRVDDVRFPDGRMFVVGHTGGEGADGRTSLIECGSGQGTTLSTFDGPMPTLVVDADPAVLVVSIDPELDIRVLAP